MSYQALYRKYRPETFDQVSGQEHIVKALRNQVESKRIGHAYLFCGTRGTGKTSVAKIFARAVNCSNPINGNPCGKCPTCISIKNNSSINVLEIDAASNNGVDNIRDIRDNVEYTPTDGRYRVFIIDEAHMLTASAFNALLKTLEEPPEYVIFILATTNPAKIPVTIVSRCQRYDFRRLSRDTIAERLREITKEEGIDCEEKALRYIAYTADGAMRDALSILEQCVSFYMGETLTYENVLDILGVMDTNTHREMVEHLYRGDARNALRLLDKVLMAGKDIELFFSDLLWYLRNLMLYKSGDDAQAVLDISLEDPDAYKAWADRIDIDSVMRYITIFSTLLERFRSATQKRVLAESALVKASRPEMSDDLEGILSRLGRLERMMEEGSISFEKIPVNTEETKDLPASSENMITEEEETVPVSEEKEPEEIKQEDDAEEVKVDSGSFKSMVEGQWDKLISEGSGPLPSMLSGSSAEVTDDDKLIIYAGSSFKRDYLSLPENQESLKRFLEEKTGVRPDIIIGKENKKNEKKDLKKILDPSKIDVSGIEIRYED